MKISKVKMGLVAASLGLGLVVGGCTPDSVTHTKDKDDDNTSRSGHAPVVIPHSSTHSSESGVSHGSSGIGASHSSGSIGG